jgi:hypothetical protein
MFSRVDNTFSLCDPLPSMTANAANECISNDKYHTPKIPAIY